MLDVRESILKANLALETDRHRRLGLHASLAWLRFVRLYRKYSDDQPRDERGRWVEGEGGGSGDEFEGATVTPAEFLQRYRSGNPDIDSVTEMLEQKMQEVRDRLGPGQGARYGVDFIRSSPAPSVRPTSLELAISAWSKAGRSAASCATGWTGASERT